MDIRDIERPNIFTSIASHLLSMVEKWCIVAIEIAKSLNDLNQ